MPQIRIKPATTLSSQVLHSITEPPCPDACLRMLRKQDGQSEARGPVKGVARTYMKYELGNTYFSEPWPLSLYACPSNISEHKVHIIFKVFV